jgi:CarD family transcriptional regulator
MTYGVGDIVIYPHHGAAVVERKEQRTHKGQTNEYLVLRPTYGSLTVMVPEDACSDVGIREVISSGEVDRVLDLLGAEEAPEGKTPGSWARRFKANTEKLRSGDIFEVAEVVRNLVVRGHSSELSAGENRLLAKAKQILLSELAAATGTDEDDAEALITRKLEAPQLA